MRLISRIAIAMLLLTALSGTAEAQDHGTMASLGILEIGLLVLLIVAGFGLARRRSVGLHLTGPTLVLRKFEVSDSLSSPTLVDVTGRTSGLTAWLLTTVGLDDETHLIVTQNHVSFRTAGLFGQVRQVVPLPSIASTHCGYRKPVGLLILGAIFLLAGVLGGWNLPGAIRLLALLIGGVCVIAYYLRKNLTIALETYGGTVLGLRFKRSVIENVGISMEHAEKAILTINTMILQSQGSRGNV